MSYMSVRPHVLFSWRLRHLDLRFLNTFSFNQTSTYIHSCLDLDESAATSTHVIGDFAGPDQYFAMASHCVRPSRVELYCIPPASRSAFFGAKCVARPQTRAVGRRAVQTNAVVAPPKPTKDLPPFEAWKTGAAIKKRTDIKTILILGPGPIIIGQVRPKIRPTSASDTRHCQC